jgi:hypothetical protein
VKDTADEAVADFEYGYGVALRDSGVVRMIYLPAVGAEMMVQRFDGVAHTVLVRRSARARRS